MSDLIDTTEMYLRTIYELEEEGVPPMRARIAERLGQSGPTVSQTVARMHRAGLVDLGEGNRLVLTQVGWMTVIFEPGEIVYMRHFQRDAVSGIFPCRTVRHDARGVLLWGDQGSPAWYTVATDGRWMRTMPLDEWVAAPKLPHRGSFQHSLLTWHPAGADYSIRFFWYDGVFTAWYANLELPLTPWQANGRRGGDTVDWPLHRRWLSRWGNRYTSLVLGLQVRDCTSGFRAYRAEALRAIEPGSTTAEGYAFLTELVRRLVRAGFRVMETPIVFRDRRYGESKMSGRIIAESMVLVTRWGLRDLVARMPFVRGATASGPSPAPMAGFSGRLDDLVEQPTPDRQGGLVPEVQPVES